MSRTGGGRRLLIVWSALFLLACTAVAAWGLYWYGVQMAAHIALQPIAGEPVWSHGTGAAWLYHRSESRTVSRIDALGVSQRAAEARRRSDIEPPPQWSTLHDAPTSDQVNIQRRELAIGWPLRAFTGAVDHRRAGDGRAVPGWWTLIHAQDVTHRVTRPQDAARLRAIGIRSIAPIRPIWSGLLLSALLLAMPVWLLVQLLLLAGHHAFIVIPRRRRGGCPRCGYILQTADGEAAAGCSECGWNRC